MLTQSAPAIVNALAGVLPSNAVQALTQALGNCNQPLTHRGPITFSPPDPQQDGPGLVGPGRWNWGDYAHLLPNSDQQANLDVAGWEPAGGWNNHNYYGDTFNFPTSQEFTLNNYYGGPNVYNGGNSFFENSYVTNLTVQNQQVTNLTVETINGEPVVGPAGPPGARGDRGDDGRPGNAGVNGFNGRNGQDGRDFRPAVKQAFVMTGVNVQRRNQRVVSGVSFNEETCELEPTFKTISFVDSVEPVVRFLWYYGP